MDTVVNEGGDTETTYKYNGPKFNPPVTRSYVTKARIHNEVNGPGADVEKEFHSRESTVMSRDAIRMAVDFLTSEEVQQTVAFGTLTMKGPNNLKFKIARQIRKRHNNLLVRQIRALLRENGMKVPAKSTLRALLRLLPAGHAKEIKGIDPTYEEHRRAFMRFDEIIAELRDKFAVIGETKRVMEECSNVELLEKVQTALKTSKSYILGYFIYNLSYDNEFENHCVTMGCSDPNNVAFRSSCKNLDSTEGHARTCDYCNLFPAAVEVLKELVAVAPHLQGRQLEIVEDDMDKGKKAVEAYKRQVFRHYVGSHTWNQNFKLAKKYKKRAMVIADYGMKWEPKYNHETSIQHFGKKALSHHATAYERVVEPEEGATEDGNLISTEYHSQVLENTSLQDSDTTIAILIASLKEFKKNNMDCEEVILKVDNAGAYHCWATVVRLWAVSDGYIEGLRIVGIHFGEPGKGKDACDKLFAVIRAHQRRCIKEKWDADTPERFAANMCKNGGIANTTVQLGPITNDYPDAKKDLKSVISGISEYHEFLYEKDGIWVRKLPGFGPGLFHPMSKDLVDLDKLPSFDCHVIKNEDVDEDSQGKTTFRHNQEGKIKTDEFGVATGVANQTNLVPKDDDKATKDEDEIFFCQNAVCGKAFFSLRGKLNHEMNPDNCTVRVKKQTGNDYAKEYYIGKNGISADYQSKSYNETRSMIFKKGMLPTIDDLFLYLIRSGEPKYRENLTEGHALPPKKAKGNFTDKQTRYLYEQFLIGEDEPGQRKKPEQVSKAMKQKPEFLREEWLTFEQINGYFKREKAKKRFGKKKEEKVTQAEIDDTENLSNARDHMETTMNIEENLAEEIATDTDPCPIVSEGVSLCAIVQSLQTVKRWSESKIEDYPTKQLKKALHALNIDDFGGKASKKKMAKIITRYVEEHCHCSII